MEVPDQNKFHKTKILSGNKMKMRNKIKFEKPEEIPLEEIQVGDNGELHKVGCVLLMVI